MKPIRPGDTVEIRRCEDHPLWADTNGDRFVAERVDEGGWVWVAGGAVPISACCLIRVEEEKR